LRGQWEASCDQLAIDLSAAKICLEKLAKRHGLLRKSAGPVELARQRTERIINQVADRSRQLLTREPTGQSANDEAFIL
jgi:hypothetical protein